MGPKKRPKIVLPLPLLCMDVLDTKTFLKHRRVPLQCFSVLWDGKFPTEKRDIPLLSMKFFDNRNVLKHRGVPLRKFFSLWNKKFSTEILDTPLGHPSIQNFSIPGIIEWWKDCPTEFIFRHCYTKKFWRRILILPSPSSPLPSCR